MNQKEFLLLTEWLKYCSEHGWTDHVELMAADLADRLKKEYPRTFNFDKFFKEFK